MRRIGEYREAAISVAALSLTGRPHDVRSRAIRDHGVATVIGQDCSDGRDYDRKGDKYPTKGVNRRRVFWIARLVQVCHLRPPP